jgi:hypothetical protein
MVAHQLVLQVQAPQVVVAAHYTAQPQVAQPQEVVVLAALVLH